MSPKGRPEGESTPKRASAEGSPVSPKGRPEGESTPKRASAEGSPVSPKGRPEGESTPKRASAEGSPVSHTRPPFDYALARPQDALRAAITRATHVPEADAVRALMPLATLGSEARQRARALARDLAG